jgi:hypothetical protein
MYYVRYMGHGWFKIAILHTKLIRMKKGMFWNILQIAWVDQGPVRGPSVLHQVLGVVQDGYDEHQTDRDNVESFF